MPLQVSELVFRSSAAVTLVLAVDLFVAISFAAVEKVDFFIALHRRGALWDTPRTQVKKVSYKLHSLSHSSQSYVLAVNYSSIESQRRSESVF